MDKQQVYQKYITHVEAVTGGGQWIDYGVLKLALRLAIDEAADDKELSPLENDLFRLQDWLFENLADGAPAIRHSTIEWAKDAIRDLQDRLTAEMASNSTLRKQLAAAANERDVAEKLLTELETWQDKQAQAKAAPLPSTPISASMAPGAPAAGATLPVGASMLRIPSLPALSSNGMGTNDSASSVSTNGSAAGDGLDPTPAPYWGADHPAWAGMTAEEMATLAGLESGAMRFGRLDKELRIKLVGRVMGELVDIDGKLSMEEFAQRKPAWMPNPTGLLILAHGGRWGELRKLR